MSFFAYDYNEKESKTELNVKKANTLANNVLKYYFGDISGEYKADTDNTAPVSNGGKYKETRRGMKYNRYVNNIQVAEALLAQGFEVDRRNISIAQEDKLQEVGIYDAVVKCYKDIKANIKVEVVAE